LVELLHTEAQLLPSGEGHELAAASAGDFVELVLDALHGCTKGEEFAADLHIDIGRERVPEDAI
jgi:hypothetical protein